MLLRQLISMEKTDAGYILHGDAADILLIFMTDDIIRFRVSFRKDFKEESYTLVTTAWADRMDGLLQGERVRIKALDVPCREQEDKLVFSTKTCILEVNRKPVYMTLKNLDGKIIYQDLKERAFEEDQLGRLSHFSRIDPALDHFYGFGEKTGHLDKIHGQEGKASADVP